MKNHKKHCPEPSATRSSSTGRAAATAFPDQPVLVIMDMQPGFPASNDPLTVYAIEQQIRQARAKNLPIIVVEYDPHEMGHTLEKIMLLLEGYKRSVVITKCGDDGSAEIFEAIIDNGFWPENLIICGVNSDSCVIKTVRGLIARVPGCIITLFQDACNSENGKDGPVWHDDFPRMENIDLRLHGA